MAVVYSFFLLVLITLLCAGLLRIARSVQSVDRFLAMQLMSTTAVAILLLIAEVNTLGAPHANTESASAVLDIALVFALLSSVTVIAFVQRGWKMPESEQ